MPLNIASHQAFQSTLHWPVISTKLSEWYILLEPTLSYHSLPCAPNESALRSPDQENTRRTCVSSLCLIANPLGSGTSGCVAQQRRPRVVHRIVQNPANSVSDVGCVVELA